MRPTCRLLQEACRITLFTRQNCGLCTNAKTVLETLQKTRPFVYREVDIVDPAAKGWRDLYDFDVPVIHISKSALPEEDPSKASKAIKLMHRFSTEEVGMKMDAAESRES